jgi:hypothetical protein
MKINSFYKQIKSPSGKSLRGVCQLLFLLLLFSQNVYAQNVVVTTGTTLNIPALTTVTIPGDLTVDAGGSVVNNGTLIISGNWTNNGSYSGTGTVQFTGSNGSVFSGSSPTIVSSLTLNKGTSISSVLDITAGSLSVTTLTFSNGLLRINTGGTFTKSTGNITVFPFTCGIHVNGGSFSTGNSIQNITGLFRVSSGTASVGTASGNNLLINGTGSLIMEGGSLNISGRLENSGATVNISGGTITVNTVGNASGSIGSFNMSATANLAMSSGSLIFSLANSAGFQDLNIVSGGTKSITGGLIQFGNSSTTASTVFRISSAIAVNNLTINNSNSPQLTLLASTTINGILSMNGGNINPGIFTLLENNTAPSAITRSSGFVNGKLKWQLAATPIPSGNYIFPVGKNSTYLPFVITDPSGNSPAITVEAFDASSAGTPDPNLSSISTTEYWQATFTGTFNGTALSLTRPAAVSPFNVIGRNNTSANGVYTSIGGTPSGNSINLASTGNTLGFFVLAQLCVQPTIICPSNISVSNTAGQCGANVTFSATVTANPTVTYVPASGSLFPIGTTTVNATATNACGTASCSFTVTVTDNQPPVAVCQNITVSLNAAGTAAITPAMIDNGSSDNCSIASMSVNTTSVNCSNVTNNNVVANGLFFSEYVEGSSNNKYIEIYNGTGASVNLSDYRLRWYANGASTATNDVLLSGTLANGSTIVYKNSSAIIYTGATTTNASVTFNGNDAVALFRVSTNSFVDIFGRIGNDPGTSWTGAGGYTTLDKTLRRKSSVTGGITVNPSGTGPTAFTTLTSEWDQFLIDDVSGLGSHTFSAAGPLPVVLTVTDFAGNTSSCTSFVTVNDNLPPTAICQNLTVQLNAAGTASITAAQINNGSTDNCAIASMSVTPNTFTCANIGGIVSNCPMDANYIDSPTNANSGANGQTFIALTSGSLEKIDVVSAGTIQLVLRTYVSNNLVDAFTGTVLATSNSVTGSGNYPGYTTFLFPTPPVLVAGQQYIFEVTGSGVAYHHIPGGYASGTAVSPTNPGFTRDIPFKAYICQGVNQVTLTVTDVNGNNSSCIASVTVQDNIAPVVQCKPATVALNASGTGSITPSDVYLSGSDNCGTVNLVSVTPNSFTCANIGANTVTLTVNDGHGNISTCTATVTVQDNVAPTAVCQNVTVQLNAAGTASVTAAQVNNGSSDNCAIQSMSVSPNTFTCANVGANTVTLTVTDVNGNSSSCTATITVQDNVAPTAVCQNVTVQLNAAGTASVTAAQVNNGSTDNCAIQGMSVSPNTFTCANVGANTVTLTVTDVNGNASSCTATVTVQDNVAPIAVCQNVTVQLNAAGTASVTAAQVNNGSSDNCAIQSMSVSPNTFTCANVGANTVTLTVTDVNGNSSSCTATVTVQDNVAPTAVCQNVTVQLNAAGTASVTAAQVNNGSTDNCAIQSMSVSPNTFTCANVGANTITLTVTDVNGNSSSCTATVTVQDNVAPTAACQNVTVQLNAAGTASVTAAQVNNGSSDNCAIQSMTVLPNTFTCANVGANTVTLTVTDVNGNSSSCNATVTVQDNVAPTAICQNVTVQLNASGTASVTAAQVNNGSTDNCAIQSVSVSPNTFTCANVGANTVTLTVTDVNGNVSSCNATVTVQDNVAPTAICQNVTVQLNAAGTASVTAAQVNNGSTDNCAIQSMNVSPNTFSCANVGANTVTLTVMDVNGNSSSCNATVTVQDNVAPTAVCQNVTVQLNASGTASVTAAQVNNGSTDNCAIQSISVSPNSFSCTNLGANTVTLTVTDVNGNVSTCNATVTVQDNIVPLISCPGNISLNSTPGVCGAVATYAAPTASDNCSFTVTQTNGLASGSVFPVGTTTNTFLITDAGGNTASCSFNVTVTDNVAPVVTNCPSSFSACNPISWTPPTFTDNCAGVQVASSHTPGTIFPPGTTTVTYTATDVYNNQTTCSFNVTVVTPSVAADTITSNRDYNNICVGENITLTIGGGTLGQGGQWKWYAGTCGGSSIGTGTTITVTPTVTTTYYARAEGQCNTTACKSITVVVSSGTTVVNPVITSAPVYGAPGMTATVTCNTVPGATFYRWTSNYGQINGMLFNGQVGPVQTTIPSVQVTFMLPQSNYQIRLVVGNACGRSNTTSAHIRGTVGAATAITGPTTVCPLQVATYSISAIPDAASYDWVLIPANAGTISGTGLSRTITFAAGFTSAQLCVNGVSNFNLAGPAYCINISTNAPTPGLISGNAQPCSGGSATYTIAAVPNATGYNWTTSVAGATVSASGTSATVTYPAGTFSGNVCVMSISSCGVSAPSCLAVTSGTPGTPGPITGPVQGICNAMGVNYSLATSNALSYSWSTPTGVTVASGGASNSVNLNFGAGFTTGTITVTATYSCGSASSSITVDGAPSVPSVTPTTICPGGDAVYFASSVGGSIYNWTISGADYDNCTNPPSCSQYYIYWSVNGGSFSVTSSNSCGTSAPLSVSTNCRISSGTEPIDSKVYPNPTSGMLMVEFTSSASANFEIQVSDLTGRTVLAENVKATQGINQHEVNLTSFNKGIYMLTLKDENGNTKVTRVAVQ